MSIIPPEIRKDINHHSGFLDPDSRFAGATLKGLFRSPANLSYLSRELYALLTHPAYVYKNLGDNDVDPHKHDERKFNNRSRDIARERTIMLIAQFKKSKTQIDEMIEDLVESHVLPYRDEVTSANPVQQLSVVNQDFLIKTSRNIIQTPDTLFSDVYAVDPDTGSKKRGEWDYDASSWSDGTWHPEHLFTNSERNRENPYWVPMSVEWNANPEATGLGHRYNNPVYAQNGRQSQFPGWRTAIQRHHYDRDNTEGFREGRGGDRRTQGSRGFDMSALVTRSTY